MKTLNEKSSAGQSHYGVSSKACGASTVGVWADNKTQAKKIFKQANPKIPSKDIQAWKADY